MPPAEADELRARIARLESACGCGLGAAVAVGVLVVYLALLRLEPLGSTPVEIAVGAAVFVGGTAAGKALGRVRALHERNRLLASVAAGDSAGRVPYRLAEADHTSASRVEDLHLVAKPD